MAKLKNKYGYFTDDGKEYVITRPDTPRPWINVISNGDYGVTISQSGTGFSWRGNANLCRINTWFPDLVKDEMGKFLYIRDNDKKKYWSVGWKPVCPNFDKYEVRHGIGYTKISSSINDVDTELTMFVPVDEPLEVWKLTIKNTSKKEKNLSVYSYIELCLGNHSDVHREFQKTFMETEYDSKLGAMFAFKRQDVPRDPNPKNWPEWPCHMFHSVSPNPAQFEGDKENFLGMYRSAKNPIALETGKLKGDTGKFYDSIATLATDIKLPAGKEKTVIFVLGESQDRKIAAKYIQKYKNPLEADKELNKVRKFWNELLCGLEVDTPDDAFNVMTNTWLKYQAISGRIWARSAFYQTSGAYGFRDQLQDSQVFLPLKPELTKKQILLHSRHQFKDGTVYHWWHTLTEWGLVTKMTDDLLWLVYVTLNYIDETGDTKILDEKTEYLDGPKDSIYNHCIASIERVFARFSKRGLPLILWGDWNDGLSCVGLEGKGESIWLGQFLYGILLRFANIAEKRRNLALAKKYRAKADALKKAINKYAWDGKWYIAATKDDGTPLGSSKNEEFKIYLNTQTWSIINDVGIDNRNEIALKSVEEFLDKDFGPLLLAPSFTKVDRKIGYITRYAPGARENGGVYSHAATWGILAECKMSNGEKAFSMYSKMIPPNRGLKPDDYKAEPYVMPGNTDGPESPFFGKGGWTWYTGSAAWMFRISTEWICGVRPTRGGLLIDPCIPKKWAKFKIKRLHRGVMYDIEVDNPKGVSRGVKKVYVDGKEQNFNVISYEKNKKVCKVKIIMG